VRGASQDSNNGPNLEYSQRIHANSVTTNSMGPYSLSLGRDTNWNLSDVKSRSRT
jgi:hypothetical protein